MLLLHLGANHQDDDAQDSTLKISIPKVPFADFGLAVISSEAPLDSGFKTVFASGALRKHQARRLRFRLHYKLWSE